MSETAEAQTTTRGRPRPQATIDRDAKVLSFITASTDGANREAITAGTELPGNEVYLSLYRLRRDGKIVRNGATWRVAGSDVAPAE